MYLLPPGSVVDAHTAEIREMAVNMANPCNIASGGLDQKLCILDLSHAAKVLDSVQMDSVIGSVKWPTCNQSKLLCACLSSDLFAYRRLCELHSG